MDGRNTISHADLIGEKLSEGLESFVSFLLWIAENPVLVSHWNTIWKLFFRNVVSNIREVLLLKIERNQILSSLKNLTTRILMCWIWQCLKFTCKERWRQVLADRIKKKHLLTLGTAKNQTECRKLQLVLPEELHQSYEQQAWLVNIAEFHVLSKQR